MPAPADYRFIFLCGLHRSGTTPLFRILQKHPEVSGFLHTGVPEDEGQHLQTVFPAAKEYGGPGRFGFATEAHLTETSSLISSQNRQLLLEQWSRHWDLRRNFLLEKSPPNLIRTRFLQAMFPESYFIVILRHPVAVSLATVKWSRTRLQSLMEHWVTCHGIFEEDRCFLKRVIVIRYEDLIRSCAPTLELLRRFLGLNSPIAGELDPKGNDRYFHAWRAFRNEDPGRGIYHSLFENYESRLRTYGYSLGEIAVDSKLEFTDRFISTTACA